MPLIATKITAITAAAATVIGGFLAGDDLSNAAKLASDYVEIKVERHTQELGREALTGALASQFSDQGGNP